MQQMKNQEPNKEVFVDGAWKLIDIKGNLVGYTSLCCDILIEKQTRNFDVVSLLCFLMRKPFQLCMRKHINVKPLD